MTEKIIKWTIQGHRGEAKHQVQEFNSKREAVRAMETQRQPKTPIERSGNHYNFKLRE